MKNRGPGPAIFLLTPPLMFVIAETVTGNLLRITPAGYLLNLALYYLLYLGVYALFGSSRISFPALNLLVYALAAGEYFVTCFRERPIMIWDALALRTAMTVSANYRFALTPRLVLTCLAALLLTAGAIRFPLRGTKRGLPARWRAAALWGACCASFLALLFGVLRKPLGLDVHMWDPIVSFEREGFLLSTVLSVKTLFPERPRGYGPEAEAEILARLSGEGYGPEAGMSASPTGPENVICIMNESFSDLGIYNDLRDDTSFETDQEYLSFYHGLTENAEKGLLYVPVFGAMTANTEYEFLTGNACALAPSGSVPYQFYTRPGDDSLARIFGENGYRTVAMHPYPGYNWNRTRAYANLGFDEFLDLAYFDGMGEELEKPRGYMSDRSNYDGIIRVVESKEPGQKLFLFNVTMQNHGGYEVGALPASVHVTRQNGEACAGKYPKADQYLTLMRMSDEALRYLLEYFERSGEPTMIVLFGDHQPSVETEFFEALYGERWSETPEEQKITSFATPYLIWTNYPRGADASARPGVSEDTAAFLLGNRVLRAANILPSGYRRQLSRVEERFRAVHPMGVLLQDGTFRSILELESLDDYEEIHALHILQYGRMFQ